ncbi:MAG: ATP-binding protein [Pseudonocardiales bacterium]|nr:ATP-binding protein [Pseudonocardiales bacterium]
MPRKPAEMFDRDDEWNDLVSFAVDDTSGATLGVVSGRRRQGKTMLLYSLAQATNGLYFAATEATEADSLRRLGQVIADHVGAPAPLQLDSWEHAVNVLLEIGRDRSTVAVLDEFPYLALVSRALPSVIQHALTPGRPERTNSRTRLLLCGSAMSFMRGMLSGTAPLRGRAGLELRVAPLDYRLAAQFWNLDDPHLAVLVNAIVGGTPAYRREYVRDDTPNSMADFDSWVVRAVLSPVSPLFREARYLLAEDPGFRDPTLYHSVLAAVAEGNTTRGGIANYIGRKATDLQHPLTVLEDAGLLARDGDPLRSGRSNYRITEPLVAFYQAIMRPAWTRLERRHGAQVWLSARPRFESALLGPHFEQLCRTWVAEFAAPETLGGIPATVGHGVVNDAAARTSHEVDIVALGDPGSAARPVLALGEATWGKQMGLAHLDRLHHIRGVLRSRRDIDVSGTKLLCASGVGFTPELRSAAAAGQAILVDLDRLYRGV